MTTLNQSAKHIGPTEKRKGGMRSIRTKIAFWAGLSLALVSLTLIGYSVINLRQTSIDNSTREAVAIAEANAGSITSQLDLPLLTARTLANSLKSVKDSGIPITLSRDEVNGMLRKVLIENPSFLGTYTLWEPNAFDGADAKYIRAVAHDETGRFIPYWVRGDDGIIHTEALVKYETPGVGDWYLLPRSTKQETTIAPIFRRIQSQDVVIASFIIPIVHNDKFYGIAGVDAPIGFVQQLVDNIDLYDGTANAVLFTDTGTLVAVRQQPELTNQPANLIYADFDQIQSQLDSPFTRLSPDGQYLQIFSPIDLGKSERHWVMGLIIPMEKITAPATAAAVRQIMISIVFILFALALLWFLAGQIIRPMQVLTDAAKAVSQGNWTVTAEVHSNDEVEVLANAFNFMTSELQNLFNTLEQRVAARTRALATSSEVSRRLSTILNRRELAIEVVEQVKSAFGYYHAHIYLYNDEMDELVMAGGTGDVGAAMLAEGHKIPKGRGLVGRAGESNEPVLVSDTMQDPGWLPNPMLPDTRSEVALPISIGDQVLGVLDVQHDVADGLGPEDVDALVSIANQVAVAIQNINQYEKTQKMAADLGVVANVSIATSTITETGHLLQEVVDLSKQSFNLYHVHIYLLNETGDVLELASGAGEVGRKMVADGRQIPLNSEQSLVARAARIFEGVIANDVQADPDFLPNPLLPKTRAEMAVPMLVSGEVIGVLDVQAEQVNRFTDIDVNIQTTLASQIAVALQNARSFANAQKQAERETKLNLITQKIQSTATIEEAMQITVRELGHALGRRQTLVTLDPPPLKEEQKGVVKK